jgi:hypothetical protein
MIPANEHNAKNGAANALGSATVSARLCEFLCYVAQEFSKVITWKSQWHWQSVADCQRL